MITSEEPKRLATIKEASQWASELLKRDVSESNISYLVQYGKVRKRNGNGATLVDLSDLRSYYQSYVGKRESHWKKRLGNDLNWALSFDHLREKDTTKHVHRLHPYKGKFIPQLVEYFIDEHTDNFKKEVYFKPGDIILDPFSGSGTTLVQANEMGIRAIGVDISRFNSLIAEVKLLDYHFKSVEEDARKIRLCITGYEADNKIAAFDAELSAKLSEFNDRYFPGYEFKYRAQNGGVDEDKYAREKEKEFLKIYTILVAKYGVELKQGANNSFLDKWYIRSVRREIDYALGIIEGIKNAKSKKVLTVVLSRTIRSCRATTHSDLATLKDPQLTTYYCYKHKKICKPLFSIKSWFERYTVDTVDRLKAFARLKSNARFAVVTADARTVDLTKEIAKKDETFYEMIKREKVAGIFTSPPYVGQIDYHEQHAYSYDLFGFERNDEKEIGPLSKGQGKEARNEYVQGVSTVLNNSKRFLKNGYNIFLVANDKYNLYPTIAEKSDTKIVNQYRRPVLNRTERDKGAYSEIIFHLKAK